jgi:nitrogen fixation protein FixH
MKFNWGTGIVLAFIGFISFILFFVYRMLSDDKANHSLVSETYYIEELAFQNEIDAEQLAKDLDVPISVELIEEGVLIVFPKNQQPDAISGAVQLYRPSNVDLDTSIPIDIKQSEILISKDQLKSGRWNITIDWTYNNQRYLHKTAIII